MPKVWPIQTNFTAGQISPRLHGRVDINKYKNGVKTQKNAYSLPHGGVVRRSGTKYIADVKTSSKKVRLVRFEFSITQAYIIEFGELLSLVICIVGFIKIMVRLQAVVPL